MSASMATLDAIVAKVRSRLAESRPKGPVETAASRRGEPHRFRAALLGGGRRVIAEFKRCSPSRGMIRMDLGPAEVARRYETAGAVAVSVLTEPDFFAGSLEDLAEARAAVNVPILRKDFIVDAIQIEEAWQSGADAILLIVAALEQRTLSRLRADATRLGLDVMVEVHDSDELQRALDAGADLVGVNNRDLRTMEVRLATCEDLAPHLPKGVVAVAESGIATAADLSRLEGAGYSAFLVGESLMRAPDPGAALAQLLGGGAA